MMFCHILIDTNILLSIVINIIPFIVIIILILVNSLKATIYGNNNYVLCSTSGPRIGFHQYKDFI